MLRRLFVGLVALVLAMSVLTVSPAGAANTASESLSDHDNNADTARVRAFGGANRYATSVAIAEAFVAGGGSGGFVESVIVASGESLVDAAAAAGLAASESAPVLLTPPSRLSRTVENFIVDEFISEVFIVGGTSVIPQSVEDALNALAPVRTVTRVAGADRYGTAVAVANEIGSPGVYCDSGLVTALLVNVDSSFADVIAVGPLAYALGLPILLTRAGALPASVAGYLADAEIERVVVVGGTAAVSAAVVADVNEAGVDDVVRISGANRYDTALEIRQAISDCDTVSLSPTTVALVNGAAAADGVSAGPLLGVGLATDADGVTPVLLVDSDGLPSDTRNFLRGLPTRSADASFVDLSITAIGGSAVVPDAVVQAAIAAATTSSPITATVTARVGSDTITVVFSAPVNGVTSGEAGFTTSALNRVHYRVSGGPLLLGDSLALSNGNRTLTITMADDSKLKEGTAISVADGTIKGQGADNRRVVGAQVAVRALPADRVRPNIDIFAPQGSHAIRISVTEPNLATAIASATERNVLLERIQVAGAALYVPAAAAELNVAAVLPSSSSTDITICLFGLDDAVCEDTAPTGAAALAVGETVTIASGAFVDDRGNESRSTSQRVTSYSNYPRVTRATVTSPVTLDIGPAAAPAPQVALWRWQRYDSASVATNVLTIAARPDSAAGGATGNGWRVIWVKSPDDTDTDPEVSVSVNKARKTVLVSFDDDATIFSVVTALSADSGFAELFTVNSAVFANSLLANEKLTNNLTASATSVATCAAVPAADTTECGQPNTSTPWTLRGGVSVVVVTLSYSETLSSFDYASLVAANQAGAKFPSAQRTASGTRARQLVGWQADPFTAELDLDDEFSFLLTTSSPSFADLPKSGDTISLPTALGTTFAPTDCSGGLSANSDSDPCGQSIAVDTPGQTLRRGSISGRIQGAETTVEPPVITATIDATAFLVTVVFSVPVDRATAEDTANYQIGNRPDADGVIAPGDNPLPEGTTVELSADRRTVTVTFPVGEENELVDRQRFIVSNAIRADGANDDEVTVDTTEIAAVLPPTTITATIAAEFNALTFTVTFAEEVSDATTGTGARNPANYEIDGTALTTTTAPSIVLSADGTVATITLASALADRTVITVVNGMIAAADPADDRTVPGTDFTVLGELTATIATSAGSLIITIEFTVAVDPASARNIANYQIDGNPLPTGTTIGALTEDNTVATIALPASNELTEDQIVRIVGNTITSSADRTVPDTEFTVPEGSPTEVRAVIGAREFTVTFGEAVVAADAENLDNYEVNSEVLPGGSMITYDPDTLTATITDLPLVATSLGGILANARVGVLGDRIRIVGVSDRMIARQVIFPTDPQPVTATIAAMAGRLDITVVFSEAVNDAATGDGARNPAHYEVDDIGVPVDSVITYDADTFTVTIILPPGTGGATAPGPVLRGLPDNATIVLSADAIDPVNPQQPANRRVEQAEHTVGTHTPITADIRASAEDSTFMVRFSEPVEDRSPSGSGTAAMNPDNYLFKGGRPGGTPVLSADGRTVTFTFTDGTTLDVGDVIEIVDNGIKSADLNDDRRVQGISHTVEDLIGATITPPVGGTREFTVTFNPAVNGAASGTSGFATSARNPANYQVGDMTLPGTLNISALVPDTADPNANVVTITVPEDFPGLDADLSVLHNTDITVLGSQMRGVVNASRRVETVTERTQAALIAVVTATHGSDVIVVEFTPPPNEESGANPPAHSSLNRANYTRDGGSIGDSDREIVSSGQTGAQRLLVPVSEIATGDVFAINNGVIRTTDTNDPRRYVGVPFTVLSPVDATITGDIGTLEITVTFDEAVSDAGSALTASYTNSAINPANYAIDDVELTDSTIDTITYDSDTFIATITLPVGSELVEGAVISIVANRINLAGGSEGDRRVAETRHTVVASTDPVTATIVAIAPPDGTNTITVTFSAPVKTVAVSGEEGFRNSAVNRANYDSDGAQLPEGTLFVPSEGNTVVTITLPDGADLLRAGDEFNIATASQFGSGGGIEARFDSRIVQRLNPAFTVLAALTAEFITVEPGLVSFTLRFSDRVNIETNELSTDYGTSAHNPANYLINGEPLLADEVTITNIAVSGQVGREIRVSLLASAYMRGLPDNARVEIIDGAIKAANDDRRVDGVFAEPGAATLPTAAFSEGDQTNIFTVLFTDFVSAAPPPPETDPTPEQTAAFMTSALNHGNYELGGADLPADAVFEIIRDDGDPAGGNAIQLSIELPQRPFTGSNLFVIGNRIIVANSNSAIRVEQSPDYLVPAPTGEVTATIAATAPSDGTDTITVTFSEAVKTAEEGEGFRNSAANRANYDSDGAQLPEGTLFVPSEGNTVVTITLPDGADLLLADDEFNIANANQFGTGGGIEARFDSRIVQPLNPAFTVLAAPPGIMVDEIRVTGNMRTIVVTFSEAVGNAAPSNTAGFPGSARNPAHYLINGAALPAGTTIPGLTNGGTVARINLPAGSELQPGDVISVVGKMIRGASPSTLQVAAAEFTVPAPLRGTITANLGSATLRVEFSEPVNAAAWPADPENPTQAEIDARAPTSALNPFNYQYRGANRGVFGGTSVVLINDRTIEITWRTGNTFNPGTGTELPLGSSDFFSVVANSIAVAADDSRRWPRLQSQGETQTHGCVVRTTVCNQ